MQKIVITGGPSAGKTSIVLALESAGEYIVKESATDWIMLQQARGICHPWEHQDFQINILRLQQMRERRIDPQAKRVFLDRGALDGLAYLDPHSQTYKQVADGARDMRYDFVFIAELLDFTETTEVRRENRTEAQRLSEKFMALYRSAGYKPILIKKGPLHERVDFVLNELQTQLLNAAPIFTKTNQKIV